MQRIPTNSEVYPRGIKVMLESGIVGNVADIMNDLLISSTRSIRNWISIYKEQGAIASQPSSRNKSYSKEFKVMMIEKYLMGLQSMKYLDLIVLKK